jgi:hypothetical protein
MYARAAVHAHVCVVHVYTMLQLYSSTTAVQYYTAVYTAVIMYTKLVLSLVPVNTAVQLYKYVLNLVHALIKYMY